MPHYSDFLLSEEDLAAIFSVTEECGAVSWDADELKNIKQRIKALHLIIQNRLCCYCRAPLGNFNMTIDIEHVLPKSVFYELTFKDFNLSVACKRCNMHIKNAQWNFVQGLSKDEILEVCVDSAAYEIIHPNLDKYKDHLIRAVHMLDDIGIVKYLVGEATEKGTKTYEYFRLHELEVSYVDQAQGMGVNESAWASFVADEIARAHQ